MSPLQQIAIGGFSACLVLCSPPAGAQTIASFTIPIHATQVGTNAAFGTGTISLTTIGTPDPAFAFTFVLPRDYMNNTEVSIVLLLSPADATAPCSIRLVPAQFAQRRANAAVVNSLDGVRGGSAIVNFATGNDINKTFKIAPSGALIDLKRGDSLTLQIRREPDHPDDTCPSFAFVGGIDVRYTPL